jgi:hypothetical protein
MALQGVMGAPGGRAFLGVTAFWIWHGSIPFSRGSLAYRSILKGKFPTLSQKPREGWGTRLQLIADG